MRRFAVVLVGMLALVAVQPAAVHAASTLVVGPVTATPAGSVESEHLLVQEWRIDNTGPDAAAAITATITTSRSSGDGNRPTLISWEGVDITVSCPSSAPAWPQFVYTCDLGALAVGDGGVLRLETRPYRAADAAPFETDLAVSADGGAAVSAPTSSVLVDVGIEEGPTCTVPALLDAPFDLEPIDIPYTCTADPEGHRVAVQFGRPNQSSAAYEFTTLADRVRWTVSPHDSAGEHSFYFWAWTPDDWESGSFHQDVVVRRSSVTNVVASIDGPAYVVPGQDATRVYLRLHNAGAQRAPTVTLRMPHRPELELEEVVDDRALDGCTQYEFRGDWFCTFEQLAPGATQTYALDVHALAEDAPDEERMVRFDAKLTSDWLTDSDVNTGVVAASWTPIITPARPRVASAPAVVGRRFVGARVSCRAAVFAPAATAAPSTTWQIDSSTATTTGQSVVLGHGTAGERIRCTSAAPTRWGRGSASSPWMIVYSRLRFVGTARNDVFGGDHRANVANMGRGHDAVDMDAGNDRVNLGPGNDAGYLGEGNDIAILGPGNDAVAGEAGNDRISCGSGSDLVDGRAGHDIIRCNDRRGRDRIYCGYGRDVAWVDRGDRWYDCDTVYVCRAGRNCIRRVIPRSRSREGRVHQARISSARLPRPGR